MKLLLLVNNWAGWQVTRFLRQAQADVGGLVLHPEGQRKFGEEIVEAAGVPSGAVFDGSRLRGREVSGAVAALGCDMALSVSFGYLLRPEFIGLFPQGGVNLHPSLLPYGRGSSPNVWNLVEGSPAGVTLHRIDAGIDTGPILAQRPVPVEPTDTGQTLFLRLQEESVRLFRDHWPRLARGEWEPQPQAPEAGSLHRDKDLQRLDEIDLDRLYRAEDLLNLLRARTFPPYPGAYFVKDGRKIHVRVELTESTEAEAAG